jgi:FtsZ-binding cell division protein ZapB
VTGMANTANTAGTSGTATRAVDFEPIDRLEEKVKRLVDLVDRLKTEQARAAEENQRLSKEIDVLKARTAAGEALNVEVISLREEREVIRTRVSDMLQQLDALSL